MQDLVIGTYKMENSIDKLIRCVRKSDGAIYAKVTDMYEWFHDMKPETDEEKTLIEHVKKQLFTLLD